MAAPDVTPLSDWFHRLRPGSNCHRVALLIESSVKQQEENDGKGGEAGRGYLISIRDFEYGLMFNMGKL